MRLQQYLNEKRSKNVIVVDVQPMYDSYITFEIEDFNEFLKEQRDILYYYNGPYTTGSDSKRDIIKWLCNYSGEWDDELYKKLTDKSHTIWYDKGYAFFRGWMDQGVSAGLIKKSIRYMMSKKENDSRDIPDEEWIEKFPKLKDVYFEDMISLPDIPLNVLKKFNGSYLVGGGKNECLKEVKILMSIFNIKATTVNAFIY